MAIVEEDVYEAVRAFALLNDIDTAIERFKSLRVIDDEAGAEIRKLYGSGVERVGRGGPVIKRRLEGWYPGAQSSDRGWAHFVKVMGKDNKEDQIPAVHSTSDTIVGLTPNPAGEPRAAKGLVVGFVQSGKTTNFTAVAAKLADLDYRMVIVLAGVHNALRSQTQSRLERYLIPEDSGRWFPLTSTSTDFDLTKLNKEKNEKKILKLNASAHLRNPGKTSLLVVKKNHVVLTKLLAWLEEPAAVEALKYNKVLVIDDEADQASVATGSINPLIQGILKLMPRSTYIGYTATPFANVFIDPNDSDDLYPRDFIYPLPRPEGYFGPEMLFGRDVLDRVQENIDGYDMIRIIPEEDEFKYRPKTKADEDSFEPEMTQELRDAVSWFLLATAARWLRQGRVDSSLLIHTSFKTRIHEAYRGVLEAELGRVRKAMAAEDSTVLNAMRTQWESETSRVPAADWGRIAETFDELVPALKEVIDDVRIIIDNSNSDERLDYETRDHNTVIVVGGNTLSRGITLEGLVASLFLRPTNTYDTLLQMGRWFGFRTGYEDLPRIWTTDLLRRSFRHLSLVEHEMRQDMEVYQLQNLTPTDAAVRIRTHPALRVTAKMGAAAPARTSFSGARLQVRYYHRLDENWLRENWEAGERLIQESARTTKPRKLDNGNLLYCNVPVSAVLKFLQEYKIISDQSDVDTDMIERYVNERNGADHPQLTRWNIAIRGGEGAAATFAGHDISSVNRAPLRDQTGGGESTVGPIADIGTLMVPQDLVIDIPEISSQDARKAGEAGMKMIRSKDENVKDHGLIVLYPIDKDSSPSTERSAAVRGDMNAAHHVLGVGFVFARANFSESEKATVRSTHMAVDVSEFAEDVDISDELFKD